MTQHTHTPQTDICSLPVHCVTPNLQVLIIYMSEARALCVDRQQIDEHTHTSQHTHTHTHTNTHTQLMHTEKPPTHLLCCPPRSVYPPLSLSPFLSFSFLLSLSLCYRHVCILHHS